MKNKSFTTILKVDQSKEKVFDAINNARGWWSEEIEGTTKGSGVEFDYHYEDIHRCKIRITEFVPYERVVWYVVDNYFKFTKDQTEWSGTKVIFEIKEDVHQTVVQFTHEGLTEQYECYEICCDAWTNYIQNSLFNLITKGKGDPVTKQGNAFQEEIKERLA